MAAIAVQALPVDYTITGNLPGHDGEKFYVHDYDIRENIDSAIVTDGRLIFKGSYDRPAFVRVECDRMYANCVLDTLAEIDFDTHLPVGGSLLNRRLLDMIQREEALQQRSDSIFNALLSQGMERKEAWKATGYFDKSRKLHADVLAGNDNGVGYCAFMDLATDFNLEPDGWDEIYRNLSPAMKETRLARETNERFEHVRNTLVGKPFIDFDGKTLDDTPVKFSDYIGKGKYVLVDFWASWCVPCREEAKETLMPLYEKYKDSDKFEILGVAVWDNPKNTKKFLESTDYPWQHIIDAGMTPMNLYGFNYVPMIMLFAPDGTILERNIRGAEITEAVEKCLQKQP